MKVLRLLPLLVGVLVIACDPPSGAPSSTGPSPLVSPTGAPSPAGGPPRVLGSVTAGPVCPVEQSPPDPRCAPRPVAGAVIVATNGTGQEVGRVKSAADGSYELIVGETGTVLITALPVDGLVRAPEPVPLTVSSPGTVERVDLEYDTGMR
jgi:hypothetical protein